MDSPSNPASGTSTPRFTTQTASAEDLLKSQTVGLVNLADFRKRRADVLDQKEKEAREGSAGSRTPDLGDSDGAIPQRRARPLKKRHNPSKGLLSFTEEEEDDDEGTDGTASTTGGPSSLAKKPESHSSASLDASAKHRKLTPNPGSTHPPPRVLTKATLAAESVAREKLRKEFVEKQEAVKQTEVEIPFVFYDGVNTPGGSVRVKKGDHIWLFLERCRKVGAELGVSGTAAGGGTSIKSREDSRKQWARVGVDDLMCVRGEVIIPHHYEFYYFIANQIPDPTREGGQLFEYSGTVPGKEKGDDTPLLRVSARRDLEGHDDDPAMTKVVDRRWYEKNKHIYPASVWKEFKVGKEFVEMAKGRRDAQGNAFFFS